MQKMPKILDEDGNLKGYTYRCTRCHSCGPIFPSESDAIDDYLIHQSTAECIAEEKFLVETGAESTRICLMWDSL